MIDRQQTLARVVVEHPTCAAVFRRHRLDFCCHGAVTLEEAARSLGLEVETLLAEVEAAVAAPAQNPELDLPTVSTPRLVAHIVSTHHEYLRRTLPAVQQMAHKVHRVHGDRNGSLAELALVVDALAEALLPHLEEEETVLFPALCAREPDRAALAVQLAAMQEEHHAVAVLLARVHSASDGLVAPSWACTTYRTLVSELSRLEADTFTHVHLENHLLLPRFVAVTTGAQDGNAASAA